MNHKSGTAKQKIKLPWYGVHRCCKSVPEEVTIILGKQFGMPGREKEQTKTPKRTTELTAE